MDISVAKSLIMRSLSPFIPNTLPVAIAFKTECTSEGMNSLVFIIGDHMSITF